jgi:UDP-N-acetylglucosamine 2-epimerase
LNYRYHDQINANYKILDDFGLKAKEYVFMTCHRASNTDNIENLKEILEAINEIDLPVLLPLHPRTRHVIEKNNLKHLIASEHIIISKPLGYLNTQSLIQKAKCVLTDSGGVTKEAYYYKTPGIIIDLQTEWIETVNEGWNFIAGPNRDKILERFHAEVNPKIHSNCLGDGKASEKIAAILQKEL